MRWKCFWARMCFRLWLQTRKSKQPTLTSRPSLPWLRVIKISAKSAKKISFLNPSCSNILLGCTHKTILRDTALWIIEEFMCTRIKYRRGSMTANLYWYFLLNWSKKSRRWRYNRQRNTKKSNRWLFSKYFSEMNLILRGWMWSKGFQIWRSNRIEKAILMKQIS